MKRFHWSTLSGKGHALHVMRARLDGKNATPPHKQDFPEVFWIEGGRAVHRVNGKPIPLATGDLVFMRSTDYHSLASDAPGGFVLVNIAFAQGTLDFMRSRYFPSERRWFWKPGPLPDLVRLDPQRLEWLRNWVGRLDSSPLEQREIDIFLLELFRQIGDGSPCISEAGPEWLIRALERLKNQEVFSGGTEALAKCCGRTSQHVNACLQRFHGLTATEAVNAARMEFAESELRTSTKKIIEICFDCGFQNLAHFYRVFRTATGTTPQAYRQRHQLLVR